MIIEPCFAERHDFGMPRAPSEIGWGKIKLLVRMMRMRSDRAEDVRKPFSDRKHIAMASHARRNRDHANESGVTGARNDAVELSLEIGKVEMAVAIDEHGIGSGHYAAVGSI